jgi:hypothetical protein
MVFNISDSLNAVKIVNSLANQCRSLDSLPYTFGYPRWQKIVLVLRIIML